MDETRTVAVAAANNDVVEVAEVDADASKIVSFKLFTKESYIRLQEREAMLKERAIEREKHAQDAHLVDGELKFGLEEEEDSKLPPVNADLTESFPLTKAYGRFPDRLMGRPIEELDPGIEDKTFVVISKRFSKRYINRFSATKALFLLTPWNIIRRLLIRMITHQFFDMFIFMTIIANCVFLAMPELSISEQVEYLFLAIYSLECVCKVLARGFVLNRFTYLRDPWNWLDFIVIITAYLTIIIALANPSLTVGNLQGLRTFRVLRALKTVSIVPGLKTIVNALLRAFKMLFEVILLTMFCLMVFAMFGLQVYMGTLRQKCVAAVTGYTANPSQSYDMYYAEWIRQPSNWYESDEEYVVCGNSSGAGECPNNYTCLGHVGDNPRYGYLNFDHFGWALLTCFQLITLDFWEDIYNKVIRATGPWNVLYFVVVIFFGSFYLINLMLAVVSMSYEEEAVSAGKEKEREKKENARNKSNPMYDVTVLQKTAKRMADDVRAIDKKLSSAIARGEIKAPQNDSKKSDGDNEKGVANKGDGDSTSTVKYLNAFNKNPKPGQGGESTLNNSMRQRHVATKEDSVEKQNGDIGQHNDDIEAAGAEEESNVIKADTLEDPETGQVEGKIIDRNFDGCSRFCCKYIQFLKIQNLFNRFVSDPLFDLFITSCIIINTVFLAVEHHDQVADLTLALKIANYIFTSVFIMEAVCKLLGLGKYYFHSGWNIFDLTIVIASILDLGLEQVNGLSVLRTFRLLRVFKLAQSWTTMRVLLTIIVNTLGALGNLCIILLIVIYIFAVIGLQLFRKDYVDANFGGDGTPRWNFTDFYHSMLMIFRVLCGEWIEPLYDCMRASNELCMVVFLPALVFGNFIVLNLFLALLLNAFASDSLDKTKGEEQQRSKMLQGLDRLKQLICCCFKPRGKGKVEPSEEPDDNESTNNDDGKALAPKDKKDKKTDKNATNTVMLIDTESESDSKVNSVSSNGNAKTTSNGKTSVTPSKTPVKNNTDAFETHARRLQFSSFRSAIEHSNNNTKKDATPSPEESTDTDKDKDNKDKKQIGPEDSESAEEDPNAPPPDCFPMWAKKRISFLEEYNSSGCGHCFFKFRKGVKKIVDHKAFETVVLLVILGSSLTLAFEDIYLYSKPTMEDALMYCNIIFGTLFTVEMILKWIGLGVTEYFTSFWCLLDFFIVCISILSLIGDSIGLNNITAFRSLRTLRALRPLRAISRWQGMKIVVNALMNAIPAIINVFLVCMVFWLIFSIMGVQFFAGQFYKCINTTTQERLSHLVVKNKSMCEALADGNWTNSNVNFDNSVIGFLALFQVATFEGWMEIMEDAVDIAGVNQQPIDENTTVAYMYFVIFIVFGSFFSLNLFIGVIIDNFNVLKKKYEGSYLDAFLTPSQRNYYMTLKKLGKKKPQKTVKRPKNKFQLFFYNLSTSNKFELTIVILIFFNMVVMAIDHYKMPDAVTQGLEMMNILFTVIFTLESVIKIVGLRLHYFRFLWNIFDFIIVIISILGIILSDVLAGIFVTPTLLRIVRVFRIGRVLRLVKAAKGIRKLLFALIISLPAIFNIGALLFLVMYMYAIIGMSSFGNVKLNGVMDEVVNFRTFGNSFMVLLRLATSAGWNDILDALLVSPPHCNPDYYTQPDGVLIKSSTGDCGIAYLAIPYMVTYIIIVWLIVINMYIAVILENFNQAHEQEEMGITEDDFDMFYVVWEKYDPHATQFIKYEQLADFVNDLEKPLQIPKPNEIALVAFNLPIMEGEKMHCLDILIALVRNVLSDVEESEEMNTLKEQMEAKFAQNFPSRVNITVKSSTLQRKKEDVAARTLQRAWKSCKAQKAIRNITALAVQQKIRRQSAVGLRTRNDVMRNLQTRLSNALNRFFTTRRVSVSSAASAVSTTPDVSLSKQPKLGQHLQVPTVFTLYPGTAEKSQTQSLEL